MKPERYAVVLTLSGYPDNLTALAEQVRSAVETHPTLSMRLESATAHERFTAIVVVREDAVTPESELNDWQRGAQAAHAGLPRIAPDDVFTDVWESGYDSAFDPATARLKAEHVSFGDNLVWPAPSEEKQIKRQSEFLNCDGPQAAHDHDEAEKAAADYFDALAALAETRDEAEIERLKRRLDDLLAPTNDNPAFVVYQSFLRGKRLVTEALVERLEAVYLEVERLDGVVTPEILGDVLQNLRRVLRRAPRQAPEQPNVDRAQVKALGGDNDDAG